jgi:regulation of enolase protein 1 (concanavalin A-like superfamily)
MSGFTFFNTIQSVPSAERIPVDFSITASPSTDIWAIPPSTIRFNAPILHKTVPLKSFKRARVAIAANWKDLYDQGGLILVIHGPGDEKRWIKTGIEFTEGKAFISTVAKDRWADWSLLPVPSGGNAATIEIARESSGGLWIYLIEGVQRTPIREVTWAFEGEETKDCWIGTYAAKPSEKGKDLVVDFRHLVVELIEEKLNG